MAQSNGGSSSESDPRGARESDQSARDKKDEKNKDKRDEKNKRDEKDPRSKSGEAVNELSLPGAGRLGRIADSTNSTQASAYQGAMEAGFSIVIAMLIGYWADEHFATAPRYLIVGSVVGFGSMVLRLMRMRKLLEDPDEPENSGKADRGPDDD